MASKREGITQDGRRYYEFRCKVDVDGPQHTERWYIPDNWGKTRIEKESDKALLDFERRVRSGEHKTKSQEKEEERAEPTEYVEKTLRKFVEEVYWEEAELSENTRASYTFQLNLHILPLIGDKKIRTITPDDIEYVFHKRKASGCAYESVLKVYTVMRSVFNVAYKRAPKDNPMLEVERPKKNARKETSFDSTDELVQDEDEGKAYTKEELIQILKTIKGEPLKWRLYISIIVDTGIRRGECTALKWSCIDFRKGNVKIEESVGYTKAKGVYRCPPKGNRPRTVSLSDETLRMLYVWKADQEKKGIFSDYIFTRKDSPKIMFPTTPTTYFKRLGKRLGIEDFHPHKLRHTFASINIIDQNGDIESLSKLMGHANVTTTLKVYTHASEESKIKMAQLFHDAIHGSKE